MGSLGAGIIAGYCITYSIYHAQLALAHQNSTELAASVNSLASGYNAMMDVALSERTAINQPNTTVYLDVLGNYFSNMQTSCAYSNLTGAYSCPNDTLKPRCVMAGLDNMSDTGFGESVCYVTLQDNQTWLINTTFMRLLLFVNSTTITPGRLN